MTVSADMTVVASTPPPTSSNNSRLMPRAFSGLGRALRGTAHTLFIAFWHAWATPRPP